MKKLVILGAGGFARETLDVIDAINMVSPTWDVMGFIVDKGFAQPGQVINETIVLGDISWLENRNDVHVICGVGSPEIRQQIIERMGNPVAPFATIVHPRAILTRWVSIGEGSIITAGCILTNNIQIGRHVQVNLDCTIGHDAILHDYVTLAPGVHVSGNVTLHEGSYIGTGANIIEKRTIGAWSIVGAGSTVIKDIPDNVTAVGSPAAVIKQRESGWQKT